MSNIIFMWKINKKEQEEEAICAAVKLFNQLCNHDCFTRKAKKAPRGRAGTNYRHASANACPAE